MFSKAERFLVAKTPETEGGEHRQKETQTENRAARLDRRNRIKEITERWERHFRRRSWVKPFLSACRHVQSLPYLEQRAVFRDYLPFDRIPKVVFNGERIK